MEDFDTNLDDYVSFYGEDAEHYYYDDDSWEYDEFDDEVDELTEWHDFDPDC